MKEIHKFDNLIDFTLDEHNVTSSYLLFCITSNEWIQYHFEYELYKVFMKYELCWFDDFIENEDSNNMEPISERENKISEIQKIEYGEEKSLDELLNDCAGLNISLIDCHDFNGIIMLQLIENEISLFLKIHKFKSQKIDFVILLNEDKLKHINGKNRLRLIAHEAYHIVENIENNWHSHSFVDDEASRIVEKFLEIQKNKLLN